MKVSFNLRCKLLLDATLSEDEVSLIETLYDSSCASATLNRDNHDTIISILCALKAILNYNKKILIVAPSFRGSKIIYGAVLNILEKTPIRNMIISNKQMTCGCEISLSNGSAIYAVPIGTGESLRGMRYTDVIMIDYDLMPEYAKELIFSGTFAMMSQPTMGSSFKNNNQIILTERSEGNNAGEIFKIRD